MVVATQIYFSILIMVVLVVVGSPYRRFRAVAPKATDLWRFPMRIKLKMIETPEISGDFFVGWLFILNLGT